MMMTGILSLAIPAGVTGDWLMLLLDASVKGLAILTIAGVVTLLMRKISAAERQLVWVVAMAGLLVLPVVSAALPGWQVLPSWRQAPALQVATSQQPPPQWAPEPAPQVTVSQQPQPLIPAAHEPSASAHTSAAPVVHNAASPTMPARPQEMSAPPAGTIMTWTLAIWALGAAVCLAPMVLGRLSLWRLRRGAHALTDGSWPALLKQAAGQLGISRCVELLRSDRCTMPMVWGIFRVSLLLPAEAADWSTQRRQIVLLHELAHVKRWDCLVKIITQLACAAYWFNPLAWLAAKRIGSEGERACDDLVLASGNRPSDYAEHLVEISSGLQAGRLAVHSSIAMVRPAKLEGRVRAILNPTRSRRAVRRIVILIAAALAAGIIIPLASVQSDSTSESDATGSSGDAASFGPAIQRVVYALPHDGETFLDLETGKLLTQPEDGGPDDPGMSRESNEWRKRGMWAKRSGADVMCLLDPSGKLVGLRGLGMSVIGVSQDAWDSLAPEGAADQLADNDAYMISDMPSGEELPATFVVETRDGTICMVQILAFTDNPTGVKLRHKIAPATINGPSRSPVWISLAPSEEAVTSLEHLSVLADVRNLDQDAAKTGQWEFRTGDNARSIARIDYNWPVPSEQFLPDGKRILGGTHRAGRYGLDQTQLGRIGLLKDGEYLLAWHVAGEGRSNIMRFRIDRDHDSKDEPLLSLAAIGPGPGQSLPLLVLRAYRHTDSDPAPRASDVAHAILNVDGKDRTLEGYGWAGPDPSLKVGGHYSYILDVSRHTWVTAFERNEPIEAGQNHVIFARVGEQESNRISVTAGNDVNRTPGQPGPAAFVGTWWGTAADRPIEGLRRAYIASGIEGFQAELDALRARQDALAGNNLAYDTASMVLGLRDMSTDKEHELAAELRALAEHIEQYPGESAEQWMALRDKLFSYSFGNGAIDEDSVPAQLVTLYSIIASGAGSAEDVPGAVDLRSRLEVIVQPAEGSQQTQFAHIGAVQTPDGPLHVATQRLVLTGMPAPRGQAWLHLFDTDLNLVNSYSLNTLAQPLWCEGTKIYLGGFGYSGAIPPDEELSELFHHPDPEAEKELGYPTGNVIDFVNGSRSPVMRRERRYGSSGGIEDDPMAIGDDDQETPAQTDRPASRAFNSQLPLSVSIAIAEGYGKSWAVTDTIGVTPSATPIELPEGRPWFVIPRGRVDMAKLRRELRSQRIPGLWLSSRATDDDLAHLKGLKHLQWLDLSHSKITDAGLVHLKALTGLRTLLLPDCKGITDAGIAHLSHLTGLKRLDLRSTNITDAGLAHLQGLTDLQELDISATKITDAGLVHLTGMTHLEWLDVSLTRITDAGAAHLKGLTSLKELDISSTNITDASLAHLAAMTHLASLDLNGTGVANMGLAYMGNLKSLKWLNLAYTKITDDDLASLKSLKGLEQLFLYDTKITNAGLAHLKGLTSLQKVDLSDTYVTARGAEALRRSLPKRATGEKADEQRPDALAAAGQTTQADWPSPSIRHEGRMAFTMPHDAAYTSSTRVDMAADGTCTISVQEFEPADTVNIVRALQQERDRIGFDARVHIRANRRVTFGNVAAVLDAIDEADVTQQISVVVRIFPPEPESSADQPLEGTNVEVFFRYAIEKVLTRYAQGQPIIVAIRPGSSDETTAEYEIDGQATVSSVEDLRDLIATISDERRDGAPTVGLVPMAKVQWQHVMDAYYGSYQAGAETVGIVKPSN